MRIFFHLICLTLFLHNTSFAKAKVIKKSSNKEIVLAFYDKAFAQGKPKEAAEKYIGDVYIQHNPFVADGKEAFVNYFEKYFKDGGKSYSVVKKSIAEGDLVVLHVKSQKDETDPGSVGIDIFRVENGKIVEHWDVWQKVPATIPHNNGMI